MSLPTDIQIAQAAKPRPIVDVAAELGLTADDLDLYGKYKAKINLEFSQRPARGRLVLVSGINPTAAGEGKSTTLVGLADAMRRLGKRTVMCIREPSLGPVFGVKGGAAGGGYAQVIPMEDINLHFTPKTGPRLGSRMHMTVRLPRRRIASARPTRVVLFPSPAVVGLIPETRMRRPRAGRWENSRLIFALYLP